MSSVFIFDMDGVVIDSENAWQKYGLEFIDKAIYQAIKDKLQGVTMQTTYNLARQHGLIMDESDFRRKLNDQAVKIYKKSKITDGLEQLIETLRALGYKIGLVTASPKAWANWVLPRIGGKSAFDYILSLGDNPELGSKPAPDGYIRAMEKLGSNPEDTIILEDSNNGIAAAKASGAFVVGLREHLPSSYISKGADKYVHNLAELEEYLKGRQP